MDSRSRSRRHGSKTNGKPGDTSLTNDSSSVGQAFLGYKALLDAKHDKHEALVKISRDVTIESKRIIFHLHRCIGNNKEQLLAEAELMIDKCIKGCFARMAEKLRNVDQYKYCRATTAGIQEFVEAYTFYYYIKAQTLPSIEKIQSKLQFFTPSHQAEASLNEERNTQIQDGPMCMNVTPLMLENSAIVRLSQMDFLLGIADFTGELMRMSINSVARGDVAMPEVICSVLQVLEQAFLTCCFTGRTEMARKIQTLKQSVSKAETTCYTVKIRGSEGLKHMLLHSVEANEKQPLDTDHQTSPEWL